VGNTLQQLRHATLIAAGKFYNCQRRYVDLARRPHHVRTSLEARQALDEYRKAGATYQNALGHLWNALLTASSALDLDREIRRIMTSNEVVIIELDAVLKLQLINNG